MTRILKLTLLTVALGLLVAGLLYAYNDGLAHLNLMHALLTGGAFIVAGCCIVYAVLMRKSTEKIAL
jgi:hypothetical protein